MMKITIEHKTKVMGMRMHKQIQNAVTAVLFLVLLGFTPEVLRAVQGQTTAQVQRMTLTELQQNFYKAELEMEIGVMLDEVSLNEALSHIAKEAGLKLTYRGDIVTESSITLQREAISVSLALDYVLDGTGLDYQISQDGYLMINHRNEALTNYNYQETIHGIIVDADTNEPLPGVSVLLEGTNIGAATDANGVFELNVSELIGTLVISYIGYQTQEISIEERSEFNIELVPMAIIGEEMIVTGYRTQARGAVTGSVSSINSSEFADVPSDNLSNALAGRLSGVSISQNAGTPGQESNIRIRAIGTFNNASPLFVIDGVVSDQFAFDGLSSNEVESITVLKDGAAAAVYGARAANGVVLVTTKRGIEGAPRFSYNSTIGIQSPTRIPPGLQAQDHANLINNALRITEVPENDPRYYTQDELDYYSENSWDWVEEMWRDPVTTQHSLNVSGGTSNVRYFVGGAYHYATGSFDNLSYQRLNLRGNVDVFITENLTASLDMSTDSRGTKGPSWQTGDWKQEDLYKALVLRSHMVPPYIDGMPVGNYVEWHPGVIIDRESGYHDRDWTGFNTKLSLSYEIPFVNGLAANVSYNRYKLDEVRKQFNLPYDMVLFNQVGGNNHIIGDEPVGIRPRAAQEFLQRRHEEKFNYQFNLNLNYQQNFENHQIDALFVYEQAEEDRAWFQGRRDNFISPSIDQFIGGSGAPENSIVNGSEFQSARISYVGLLGYSYDDRYMLESSFRYDGSVVFAPENRWGFFPSFSAGWRVSNETFFNSSFIDDLMLRASYGILGNDAVGHYQWLQSYNITQGAVFDSQTIGLNPGSLVNREITWEKSRSYNLGLDTRFWDNRFSFKADLFYRNTYDILGSRQTSIPSTFGASMPDENYQEIDVRGFELELGYNSSFGNFTSPINYYVRGHVGYATNEIIQLDEPENIRPHMSQIGQPINRIYGYIATGIIRTQEDLDALPEGFTILGEDPQLGMLMYRDIRGPESDEPDGRITSDDQDWLANHMDPPWNFGLTIGGSWRALSFEALFQGMFGHHTMIHANARRVQGRQEEGSYGFWANHWSPDNPNAAYPAPRRVGWPPTDFPASSWFLRDASFVRLKNLNISYDMPSGFTNTLGIDRARVFFTGVNMLLLYDKIGDWGHDPEVVLLNSNNQRGSIRSYPIMRTMTLGINIDL